MSVMGSNKLQSRFLAVPFESKDEYPHGFPPLAPNNIRVDQEGDMNSEPDNGADDQDLVSDCESCTSTEERFRLFGDGLIRVDEDDNNYEFIKQRFLSSLIEQGQLHTHVEAIHKSACSSLTAQAKLQSFSIYFRAIEKITGGRANVKYAWYGASKEEIKNIFLHGFDRTLNDGVYGRGIYLTPSDSPVDSILSSAADEDGLRHLVLCRVILGRMELVQPGSGQSHPSSQEYDSGVDNLLSPRKYIIWSTHMNSHILPEYVISFKLPSNVNGCHRISAPSKIPASPWLPFSILISALSKFLPPNSIKVIQKLQSDLRERKITRQELIREIRRITGDNLLVTIIKSYRNKLDTSREFPLNRNATKCQKQLGKLCACSKNEGFKLK